MADCLVSFLIPSRGQPELLQKCVDTIVNNCTGGRAFEILIAIDEDDTQTIALIPILQDLTQIHQKPGACTLRTVVTPHKGYARLHEYYNELAAMSSGELLALWNDDVVMVSPMWDFFLGQEVAMQPATLMWIPQEMWWNAQRGYRLFSGGFPIIHRKAYEAMGHFSQSPLNDRYLHDVMGRFAGMSHDRSYLSRVCIHHDNSHATNYEAAKPLLSRHNEVLIQNHIKADREALSSNGLL